MAAALLIATAATMPASVLTLSSASAFGANPDGTWSGGITTTTACCQSMAIEVGAFTGDSANFSSTPLTLTDGTYVLYMESQPDWTFPGMAGGVNLYFNGDGGPGISTVVNTTMDRNDHSNTPAAIADTVITASDEDGTVNGSGSLSYTSGGTTVTLTGLQWVGGSGTNPYADINGSPLTVQVLGLTVSGADSTAPGPGTIGLLGAGLIGLGALRRKLRS